METDVKGLTSEEFGAKLAASKTWHERATTDERTKAKHGTEVG